MYVSAQSREVITPSLIEAENAPGSRGGRENAISIGKGSQERMRKRLSAVFDPEFTCKDLQEETNVCFFS